MIFVKSIEKIDDGYFNDVYFGLNYKDRWSVTIPYSKISVNKINDKFLGGFVLSRYMNTFNMQPDFYNIIIYLSLVYNEIQPLEQNNIYPKINKNVLCFDSFYEDYLKFVSQEEIWKYYIIVPYEKQKITQFKKNVNELMIYYIKKNKQDLIKSKSFQKLIYNSSKEICMFSGIISSNDEEKYVTRFNPIKKQIFFSLQNNPNKIYINTKIHGRDVILIPLEKQKIKPLSKEDFLFICKIWGIFCLNDKYDKKFLLTKLMEFLCIKNQLKI